MTSAQPEDSNRSKCVVLVPVAAQIEPACEAGLRELEKRGYAVRRVYGYAAIDQARNEMATAALADGFEETMWIDSDIAFDPDAVDRLRSHGLPIVCGIYARKRMRALACHVLPGTKQLVFGAEGGLTELLYAGTGFLLVRRQVYVDIQERLNLPTCNARFGLTTIPFFQPMVVREARHADQPPGTSPRLEQEPDASRAPGNGLSPVLGRRLVINDMTNHWYLPEDYAFCERARQCEYKIMADTTIRLWHHGSYGYSWEDAGKDKERYETFYFNVE